MLNVATKNSDKIIINQQFGDGKMDVYLMTPGNEDGLLSQWVDKNILWALIHTNIGLQFTTQQFLAIAFISKMLMCSLVKQYHLCIAVFM